MLLFCPLLRINGCHERNGLFSTYSDENMDSKPNQWVIFIWVMFGESSLWEGQLLVTHTPVPCQILQTNPLGERKKEVYNSFHSLPTLVL